jgi:hypothetical protein
MLAKLTWRPPNATRLQTLVVDLPAHRIAQLQVSVSAGHHKNSDAVISVYCQPENNIGPMVKKTIELSRIIAIKPT